MDQETLRDTWEELCFQLYDSVNPGVNENVFEQKVLHSLDKLGWSHQIGRQFQSRLNWGFMKLDATIIQEQSFTDTVYH